jgi:hypothetical protein
LLQASEIWYSFALETIQECGRKDRESGHKMEPFNLFVEAPSVTQFPERVDDGQGLSHLPFYVVVALVGLWSFLALFYRIAGS